MFFPRIKLLNIFVFVSLHKVKKFKGDIIVFLKLIIYIIS